MKKLALVLFAVTSCFWPSRARPSPRRTGTGWCTRATSRRIVGVGFGWGFTVVPGVEWAFADVKIGDTVPLAFGLAGKGMINFYPGFWTSYGHRRAGHGPPRPEGAGHPRVPAAPGLLHRRRRRPVLVQLGFGLYSTYGDLHVGFATADGVAYYFNDKWAVYLEGTYWGYCRGRRHRRSLHVLVPARSLRLPCFPAGAPASGREAFLDKAKGICYGCSHGEIPERSKGADCKSVGTAFEGSNPSLPMNLPRKGEVFSS